MGFDSAARDCKGGRERESGGARSRIASKYQRAVDDEDDEDEEDDDDDDDDEDDDAL